MVRLLLLFFRYFERPVDDLGQWGVGTDFAVGCEPHKNNWILGTLKMSKGNPRLIFPQGYGLGIEMDWTELKQHASEVLEVVSQ